MRAFKLFIFAAHQAVDLKKKHYDSLSDILDGVTSSDRFNYGLSIR